jgi:8-oxo-dGTP pyrophosphatase MutT (NUDIX family)
MDIIYAKEPYPTTVTKTLFLAGPTPRDKTIPSWRPEALKILNLLGFDGHVFVPEDRSGIMRGSYDDQVEWEEEGLHRADCIVFWVPREMSTMPGLTTNEEYGQWKTSGKVVFGAPPEAEKVRYQQYYAKRLGVPVERTLENTLRQAMMQVKRGAFREDGECCVPLRVWNLASFQAWYQSQKKAGNRLNGGRMVGAFPLGNRTPFFWFFHANIHVKDENRNKWNEIVLARPDVSQVVLFHRRAGAPMTETRVVLVKEFRSTGRTQDGFVRDLPGGSTTVLKDPREVAAEEVSEEVGLDLGLDRFEPLGSCQLAATLSAHKASLFRVPLTDEELTWVESQKGLPKGLPDGTESGEITYAEIWSFGELLYNDIVDWTTLGMISRAIGR